MAHVTLVRPPALIARFSNTGPLTPPVGLAYLASSLRAKGHTASIVDAIGEAPLQVTPLFEDRMLATGLLAEQIAERVPKGTDLLGLSCMFSHEWPYARRVAQALKAHFPDVPLMAGGEHITALPEDTLESCPEVDLCVLGEGEDTVTEAADRAARPDRWGEIAGVMFRGKDGPVRTPERKRIRSVDEIPWPAWDLVPCENYLERGLGYGVDRGRSMPVVATRGCPYQCTFCSNPNMWTTRWYPRDPKLLLDEIERYLKVYRATNIDFYDLTAIVRKDWTVEFCKLVLERGLKFTWQLPSGTRSEAIDEEVSALLYAAGCRNLSYAPESGSPETLRKIKKMVKLDRMLDSMRGAVRQRLNLKANIIFGFPDETRKEVWETLLFIAKMAWAGVHDISISMFSPYPGSELFDLLRGRGKIASFSDDYFLSLISYTDMTKTVSWAESMSSRELGLLRVLGLALFYGLQYLFRPWRLARTLGNLVFSRQESRLDKSLQDYFRRTFHETAKAKAR